MTDMYVAFRKAFENKPHAANESGFLEMIHCVLVSADNKRIEQLIQKHKAAQKEAQKKILKQQELLSSPIRGCPSDPLPTKPFELPDFVSLCTQNMVGSVHHELPG